MKKKAKGTPEEQARAFREGFESIVIAIILAFLFRAFEAEAFVIPTGSMANTLRGRHKDIDCEMCGQNYQTGDSDPRVPVEATVCPSCFYTTFMHRDENGRYKFNPRHISHTGDRILVNKFSYEKPFGDPERWDVIVFKNPKNAKQNYIKRLVGLPNETISIYHGDVYAKNANESEFQLLRKPPNKLWYMLQLVNDSKHPPLTVQQGLYPTSWRSRQTGTWKTDDATSYRCEASDQTCWIDYRQLSPSFNAWLRLENGEPLKQVDLSPVLITDFNAYNEKRINGVNRNRSSDEAPRVFRHWVGDLCIDAVVEPAEPKGTIEFQLIEAGRVHSCTFDLKTGEAKLAIDGGKIPFDAVDGSAPTVLTTATKVKGGERHKIRFANVDNQLTLWVDNRHVSFNHPATYMVDPDAEVPVGGEGDPGDLHPIRIGVTNVAAELARLRVYRDIYYIAPLSKVDNVDVDAPMHITEAAMLRPNEYVNVFKSRIRRTFKKLEENQFFPMGDNSPSSLDARLWTGDQFVERDMLIGKAVFIYWPHPFHVKIPFAEKTLPVFPDVRRMKLIR